MLENMSLKFIFTGFFLLALTIPNTAPMPINLSMLILLIGFLLQPVSIFNQTPKHIKSVIMIVLGIFIWFVFSMLWSPALGEQIYEGVRKLKAYLFLPIAVMCFNVLTSEQKALVFKALYISILFSVMLSYGAWLGVYEFENGGVAYKDKIDFGLFSSFLVLLSGIGVIFGKGSVKYGHFIVLLLTTFALLFLNDGRTGYVCFLVIITVFIFCNYSFLKRNKIAIFSAFIILSISIMGTDNRLVHRFSETYTEYKMGVNGKNIETSTHFRLTFIEHAIKASMVSPVFGSGLGSYKQMASKVADPDYQFPIEPHPHNQYLLMLVEGGVVSVSLWIFFLYKAFLLTKNMAKQNALLLNGLIALSAISFGINSVLHDFSPALFFILAWAIVINTMDVVENDK